MADTLLSEATKEVLRKAGWHEDRKVNIKRYIANFEATQQPHSPIVLDFLQNFGQLKVRFPNSRVFGHWTGFGLTPIAACINFSPARVGVYSQQLGVQLCLIGLDYGSNSGLLMTMQGKVYSVFDYWVSLVGDTGVDALETLCSQREHDGFDLRKIAKSG